MKDTITYEDIIKCVDVLKSNDVPEPIKLFFYREHIEQALKEGVFDNRKGFVSYGGYDVFDYATMRKAVTADCV